MKFTDQDIEKWENKELGADADFVRVASEFDEQALDDALGMQLISIRLQRKLIADLKRIAGHYEIGYQPMIRDLLNRFVNSELKLMLKKEIEELEQAEADAESTEPVNQFMEMRQQA